MAKSVDVMQRDTDFVLAVDCVCMLLLSPAVSESESLLRISDGAFAFVFPFSHHARAFSSTTLGLSIASLDLQDKAQDAESRQRYVLLPCRLPNAEF